MVERHVVMYSGGLGSWGAAVRVAEKHGTFGMTLLFTDTMVEDEDLYRFLRETSANLGVPLTRIADGRTPWQVFRDERFLGNSSVDPCSKILKRQMVDRWLKDNCDPDDTTVYVGIDWSEGHRFDDGEGHGLRPRRSAAGWRYEAPLLDKPYLDKRDLIAALRERGIKPPRLYAMGFPHNNCGGVCCKAGQGQFALLLREMPAAYALAEAKEESLRDLLGNVSMMTDRRGDGKKKPLTMRSLRERIQSGGQVDMFEYGGCGCFIDDDTAAPQENDGGR